MTTLNIGGQRVKVGDEFLRMSPEQQQATVDEIAGSLGGQAAPQQSQAYDDALAAGSKASQFFNRPPPAPARPDLMGATAATLAGLVNGIPVIGPAIQNTTDAIIGTGMQLTGNGTMQEYRADAQKRRAQLAEANPIADIAGQVGGSIAGVGALGAIPGGANALGLTGSTLSRIGNGLVSSAGLEASDAGARGGDMLQAGLIGGALGGGIPLVGAGLGAAGRVIGDRLGPMVQSALDPAKEAARRVGVAAGRDRASGAAILSQADDAVARAANIPLSNVDRGGETVRALARSVANQNPEARATLTKLADDRFTSQGDRAVDFIKRLTGGAADDIGYQENLRRVAQQVNNPAYEAARRNPASRAVWNQPIRDLMQSDAFRAAVNGAESTGSNKAAIAGARAVKNPFEFLQDGSVTLKTNADGSRALPSLDFWNQVKINLGDAESAAIRQGNNAFASDLGSIRRKLVSSLDAAVPEYQVARQGAASFFDAEDALDAGKKFALQPKSIPEATAAYKKFTAAEKQAFQTGYASEIIDRIKAGGDRRNIIQQTFGSQAAREMNDLVYGTAKARQLEAYVRVEALADQLRGALGGSTTARQLTELGIGGVAGFTLSGDWQGALTGAALAKGGRYAGEKIDAKVMEQVAKLLTSGARADLDRAVANASLSPQWMNALRSIEQSLSVPIRGAALAGASMQGSE